VENIPERTSYDAELSGFIPGMVSPADIRHLHEILRSFHMRYILLPDYSETLDGGSWDDYMRVPPGGTPMRKLKDLGNAAALVSFTSCLPDANLPGAAMQKKFGTERFEMPIPIGIGATDRFMNLLSNLAGLSIPAAIKRERARLIDAYVDGHKITSGRRVAVYGDAEMVTAMTAFLREIGLIPVLCAAGGKAPGFANALRSSVEGLPEETIIHDSVDFADIEKIVTDTKPDIIVGSSKGYPMSRRLKIPLLRAGFPIHDRMGGQRILHLGYRGAQQLFDSICNLLLEYSQDNSPVGYSYM
jgi:nitrogenase molybdenum-iron protein NifN